ncbi:aldehyde dehydrogenase family protein [Actinomadura nitritigenes]|uniref:aldehyde dehydrogenase family protein n=1 Tax=Actinomadura nitritigenes TaxID=134602 RepID=UPI003D8D98C7
MAAPRVLHRRRDHIYVNGRHHPVPDLYTIVSPATGKPYAYAPAATRLDVDHAVASARVAFDVGPWPRLTWAERATFLARAARLYREHAPLLAELITGEMGSPASFTAQTTHPPAVLDHYSTAPPHLAAPEIRDGYELHHEPVGVVGIITPWNMPSKTILMKLAPALLAGCTAVVKPAPQTPLDALELAGLLHDAGIPPGVVNVVTTPDSNVAEHLVTHPAVDKIAFTGSTATGSRIAAQCGADIRRCTLELGGKSPMVITEGADAAAAVATVPALSLANSGQICSNLTRILVHQSLYTDVLDALHAVMDRLIVGDPADPATDIGPLVTEQQRNRALDSVHRAVTEGATLHRGGFAVPGPGWYFAPAILTTTDPANHAFQAEIFAPVLTVTPFHDDTEAVRLANATPYGLDAAVWADDPARARAIAAQIRSGTVRVNGAEPPVTAPLGGFRRSGIGRELGPEGLAHYVEHKVVA